MNLARLATLGMALGVCSCSPPETPESALQSAQRLASQGRFEEALQKHVWFHEHALEQDGSYYGVRLSIALALWVELGRQYPPALASLKRIRDTGAAQLEAGKADAALMNDVASINRNLQQPGATVETFRRIEARHPEFAAEVYDLVDEALVEAGAYDLARKYLGDPRARLATARRHYEDGIAYAMRNREHGEMAREATETIFADRVVRLITVLDKAGDPKLARELQAEALSVFNSPRLRAALDQPSIQPGEERP